MDSRTLASYAFSAGVWTLTLLAAVFIGWGVTVLILNIAKVPAEVHEIPTPDGHAHLLPGSPTPQPVLRGGLWIGVLERVAVAATIMASTPELLALVIAVKGLGRYPELKDNPAASERFLIGTGTSILVAIAVGAAGRFALTLMPI